MARLNISHKGPQPSLNEATFRQLFDKLYDGLCRYSIQFVRVPQIAEDIVQNLFIYLWEKRKEIDIHTSYSSYLHKAVKNRSIEYLRSKFARIDFVQTDASQFLPEYSNPQIKLEEEELETIIAKVVNDLPEKCYIIFSMSRFGDLTHKQIAEKLNISVKTVEAQLTKALKRIRVAVENYRSMT